MNAQLKQKTLELQIAELKIKQHEEKLVQEQSQMKLYAEQVSQLLATEKNLRLQLTADGEKFQQFQVYLILCYVVTISNGNFFWLLPGNSLYKWKCVLFLLKNICSKISLFGI